jgi:hypothetical protein
VVAFDQYLAISRRLAEQDPSNAVSQRDLTAAHSRRSDLLKAQGQLEAALAAKAISDEDVRSRALAALAPHLPSELVEEALNAAKAISNEYLRSEAICRSRAASSAGAGRGGAERSQGDQR